MDQTRQSPGVAKGRKLGWGRKLLLGTALVSTLIAPTVAGVAPASANTGARGIRTLDVYPLQDDCSMTVIGYSDKTVDVIVSCPVSDHEDNWF